VESLLTLTMCDRVEVLDLSRFGICVWRRCGKLWTVPVELDCVHDDHDQGHDEGDGVEVEWDWRHDALLMDR
jgi:hypothetical protein